MTHSTSAAGIGAVFAGAIVSMLAAPSASARTEYPYCAVSRGFGTTNENCSFPTFEACLQEIRGLGGYCSPNSYYVPPAPERRRPDRGRQSQPR
jgi:hypothetical protein